MNPLSKITILAATTALLTGPARAQSDFQSCLQTIASDATRQGVPAAITDAALRNLTPDPKIIDLDSKQPEFSLTYAKYVGSAVSNDRIVKGQQRMAQHRSLLDAIQSEYGVPPQYIMAFWGIETNFGGAMGNMQFMPSTFMKYGVDRTGDGRIDLWNSLPDAFASAANFLRGIGWKPPLPAAEEVFLPQNFPLDQADTTVEKPVRAWAVMNWNRSTLYALSVAILAQQIAGGPPVMQAAPGDDAPLSRDTVIDMQNRQARLTLYTDEIDGLLGPKTRSAVRLYQKQIGMPADGHPTPEFVRRLQQAVR